MGLVTVVANVNGCMRGDPVKIMLCKNVVPYQLPDIYPSQNYPR